MGVAIVVGSPSATTVIGSSLGKVAVAGSPGVAIATSNVVDKQCYCCCWWSLCSKF
jgi:hypothetical protein